MPDTPHTVPDNHAPPPRISVVIPVYNRFDSLVQALDSVKAQTWPVHEILIVDDGSEAAIAAQIAGLEGGAVRVLRQAQNSGAAAARNVGLAAADGDYIALLDSDDYWLPEKLARQIAFMQQHNALFSTTAFWADYYRDATFLRRELQRLPSRVRLGTLVFSCHFAVSSTAVFARSLLAEVGFQDAALPYAEDWDWLLQVLTITPVHILREPCAVVEAHPQRNYAPQVAAVYARLFKKRFPDLARKSLVLALRFLSALFYQGSKRFFVQGKWLRCASCLALALLTWPLHGRSVARQARHYLRLKFRRG